MLALTLRHPWPYAICRLGKDVENRTWAPRELRPGDRFAIHAGKAPKLKGDPDYWDEIHAACWWMTGLGLLPDEPLTLRTLFGAGESALVAVATLAAVVQEHDSPWFVGPLGWLLTDIDVLPAPVPCRGARGLWHVPEGIACEL